METGKPGLALVHSNSVAAQTEKRMDIQAPLTAVYIHTGPSLSAQPYPPPPAATHSPATLHLAMPPLYSKETLPFLTLHIAGGLQAQPGLTLAAAPPAVRPKSAGKHMCPHCGRDCMKPSVLEKHLRCHTGERPYPCTTCGVSFKTQSNLYKHRRTQAHARLSSESEQSSLSSLDSSRETCMSSLSLDERSEGSGSSERKATPSAAEITCSGLVTPAGPETELTQSRKATTEEENHRMEREKPPLTASRHLTLQRQEATLFSKQWESSVSRGKSQSHESTDSGFSEISDHYPSPGSVLPEHSMDSLTESTKEHLEEASSTQIQWKPDQSEQEPTDSSRKQEQKILEERISKLISENSAVVEDKQLENVRPRKTVLSKQGSIDLPMPYTYKDSFHFDMRISKSPNVGLQGNRNHGLYSSVPTQRSNTMDHAPLTRSNSLPFSVTLLQPEKSSQASSRQSDYVTLIRRGSSGQINPTGFAIRPVNQQSSTHRPLVRQSAVDCNHATDALLMNSSVEEAYTGSLSCDGDGGEICGEPSNRKFRRKKAQKFAYNKWYMYGGGTFRKLYSGEKVSDEGVNKGRKGATHPEQEVGQGSQKRTSSVNKEAESTVNFTSATVCHPGCPPAKVSLVSALDFNQKHSKLPFSCKNPLQRNLSLSVLPLPPIRSLVSHTVDGISRAEAGKTFSVDQHSDSSSQLSGAPVPSDRKKQKTDDKLICPLEMETDPNMPTHPPPSVAGSAPRQEMNLTYISLQQNHKHTQLKGVLFQPCIINAKTPSVSTSPATSTHAPAKTSFLPKYQLKLPNAAEPDSDPSSRVVDNVTGADGHKFVSAASEQPTRSVTALEKTCSNPVASLLTQSCDIKQVSLTGVTSGKEISPCIPDTLRRDIDVTTACVAVARRQFAATTITTTCLPGNQAGLCCTSVQPTKPAGASESMHLTRPVTSVLTNSPVTATFSTASNQTSAKPPLSHTQLSPASEQSGPANRACTSSNTPAVPCHIVPLDQMQSSAQNVFHVHTADLQICLQIISDEQLALMEPQIERQGVGAPDGIQSEAQSPVSGGSSHVQRDQQLSGESGLGKESDQSKSLSTDKVKTKQSAQFGRTESNLHLTEHSSSAHAEVLLESKPSKAPDSTQHPHNYILVNMVTETQSSTGNVMSTAPSHVGVKSGRSQTSEKQHALSLNCCAKEQLLPDIRVSQGGLISGQQKLSVTPLSHNTVNQKSLRSGVLENEVQQKRACNAGTRKVKCNSAAYKNSRSESDEGQHAPQDGLSQASSAAGLSELSGAVLTFSINKGPLQLNPQTPIQTENSGDRVGPSEAAASSLRTSQTESGDGISPAHPQKQLAQSSPDTKMETLKDNPALLTSIHSSSEELTVEASQTRSAAQKEPQTRGQAEPSARTHEAPKEAEGTNQKHLQGQRAEGVVEEGKSGGIEEVKQAEEQNQAKSDSTFMCSQDATNPEGDDRKVVADSFRNSLLLKQRPQDLSQMLSGMSEQPSLYAQRAPSISSDFNSPASCSQTRLHSHPQLPSETNSFCFSQQHWDSSVILNQPKQSICKSNPSPHIRVQVQLTEKQEPFSHQDQKAGQKAGHKQADVTPPEESITESQKSPSSDAKTSSSTQPSQESLPAQVTRVTAGPTDASNTVLDDNTAQPVTHPEPEAHQDTRRPAPTDHVSQSSDCERSDNTIKYQSLFLAGQLHGYQPAECVTSGVRPVQICQDYTEDTSSSDDEGKLIIEL